MPFEVADWTFVFVVWSCCKFWWFVPILCWFLSWWYADETCATRFVIRSACWSCFMHDVCESCGSLPLFISRGILRIKPTYVCRAYMLAIEHIRASLPHMCVESEHICSYETIYAQFWIQPYVQKFTRICSLSTHICGSDSRICSIIVSIYALQTYVGLMNIKSPTDVVPAISTGSQR